MKIRNIISLPLMSTLLFTACAKKTTYDPLTTIKYSANALREDYSPLPHQGYYVVGKDFTGLSFDDLKGDFTNYIPKGFDVKYDWYESALVSGEITWNVLYTNELTEVKGELYYDKDCGNDCIQLWIVTCSIDEKTPQEPVKVTYSEFHEKAVEAESKAPDYKKVALKGIMSYGLEFQVDHEFTKTDEGWVLTKGDDSIESEVREIMENRAMDEVEGDTPTETTSWYAGNGFIVAFGYGASTFNEYGRITYMRAKKGISRIEIDVTWTK